MSNHSTRSGLALVALLLAGLALIIGTGANFLTVAMDAAAHTVAPRERSANDLAPHSALTVLPTRYVPHSALVVFAKAGGWTSVTLHDGSACVARMREDRLQFACSAHPGSEFPGPNSDAITAELRAGLAEAGRTAPLSAERPHS